MGVTPKYLAFRLTSHHSLTGQMCVLVCALCQEPFPIAIQQSLPRTHGPLQAPQPTMHGLLQAPQLATHEPLQVEAMFPTIVRLEAKNLSPLGANS